ncbi:uncharacterized protein LOC129616242 [Condylostylus longicornis]|uniref:uncharacterized protein LOC129616242 n=1 Tax=Condylostylus longicornis TaxID=2530218 RepID=UPI00244DD6B4|nr:uncharacterized protein LOC129616242 [Condylostylus longicornis]
MSSSIFAESPISTNESRMSDSNLVVVYGKNGVNNVDREGLENLIDDKGLSTISVVRLTSPTPSMKDEEESDNEIKRNKKKECEDKETDANEKRNKKEDVEHSEKSTDSELESEEERYDDIEEAKKIVKEKPEAVGLIIEDFCLPDKTKEITKAALALSGLQPLTVSVDFEIQMKALKNDHCYTPLTSPSELLERKPEPKPLSTSTISAVTSVKAAQKMAAIKAQNAANRAAEKSIGNDENEKIIDEYEDNESLEDENGSDYSESEESADTDNDRDSDLDFDVNDRTGRKRKTNKKFPKRKFKNKILKKRQSTNIENHLCQEDDKKSKFVKGLDKSYTAQTIPQTPISSSNINIQKIAPIKYNVAQSPAKMLVTSSKMEIRVQNRMQSLNTTQNAAKPVPQVQNIQKNSRPDILSNIITGTGKPSGDPSGKPVVQNVVIIKPPNKKQLGNTSGGFTDITKYLSKTDNMRSSNVQVCELIKPDSSGAIILRRSEQEMRSVSIANNITSNLSPSRISKKGFMPLVPDKIKSQMLPAQISVQVQQKVVKSDERSFENIETQKEINLSDSLRGQIRNPDPTKCSANTIKIIKTYEDPNTSNENSFTHQQTFQKKPIIIHSNTSHSAFASTASQVDSVDISNAPLLETPDDIPEDLIKDMAELIDHKTLQELVEEQQQQQLQNQRLNQSFNVTDFETNIPKNFLMQPVHQNIDVKNDCARNILEKSQTQNDLNRDDDILNQGNSLKTSSEKNNYNLKESQSFSLQPPVQVVSRSGRVITLPPIEAPTTRAKRRAAATTSDTPTPPVSSNASEASESEFPMTPKSAPPTKQQHRSSSSLRTSKDQQKRPVIESVKKQKQSSAAISISEDCSENESSEGEDEDDPNKLWCICRQPHNNRFMICCDSCEDWFHGTCVGVTKNMGKEMELKKIEWTCPNCKDGKKQQNIKIMFEKQSVELTTKLNLSTPKIEAQDKKEKNKNSSKKLNSRKPSEVSIIPPLTTPLSKSMQQKISEIIGVPLPEPIQSSSTENIDLHSSNDTMLKKRILKGTRPLPKDVSEKTINFYNKKKTSPTPGDHESGTNKSHEVKEKNLNATKERPLELEIIFCIVCKKQQARPNSIYCSDDCIRKHAHDALSFKATKNQLPSVASSPGLGSDGVEKKKKQPSSFEEALGNASLPTPKKIERVCVFERKTGKILTGNNAPTTANLKRWLQENPTFEVIQPGSPQAQAVERNKQKQKSQIVLTSEAQQRSVQSYRQQPTRSLSQQKHVIKIIKSISSNPSPKSDGQLQEVNEVMHKPVTQKLLTIHHIFPSKGEKSEIKQDGTCESTENKMEKLEKLKFDKNEKSEKTERQSKSEKSPTKAIVKKQSSKEKEKEKTEPDKEKIQNSEPIRLNVKRTLKEKLITRLAETTEENHPKMSEHECEKYANETEEEMFELFKDTGVKYKAKYRSLVFNIKDHKNKTLFKKICEKSIEPKQLVRMTPEELASQELAQWRENENKHQLEMIKKSELDLLSCAKNYVLKTHKGEEVIEDKLTDRVNLDITIPVEDVVAVLNNSTVSSTSEIEKITSNWDSIKFTTQTQENDVDSSLGSSITKIESTIVETSEHMCEIDSIKKRDSKKDKEKEKRYKNKDRHREKSSRRSKSRSKSRDRKRRKTPQKEEDTRSHYHKAHVKEKFTQSPEQDIVDITNRKETSAYYDETDGNHCRQPVHHEPEEELHGFDENEFSSKCKYKLSSASDNKKRKEKDEKSENFDYADEVEPDRTLSKFDKKEEKLYQCSRYHFEDDKKINYEHKRRSYTYSPSLEEDEERKRRRHQSSGQTHQHHRPTTLVNSSSPPLEGEECRKDLISKLKNDLKSFTPTSTTTTSETLVSNKKYSSSGVNKQISSNKIHKNKIFNQKSRNTNLSEYSLIDKIFAESEKTIEEAANLVPIVLGKEKSLVKPADSQSSTPKYTAETLDILRDMKRTDSSGNDSEHELPSSTVTIPTPPEDPYKHYASDISTIIWTGNINMIDVATFNIVIQPISGNCTYIEKEFPIELDVVGRIGPDTVWDYIGKIKKSPNKEIVLVRLVPSPESETNAYTALYLYLEKRKRLGVVKSTSPGIKDFYILPLQAKTELPAILQTVFNSESLDDDSKPDLLVGIIIRIMDFGHSKRYNTTTTSSSSLLSESISKIVRKPLPPNSSSSILKGETTVIQNKKILGLGELTEEDYKPESPHIIMAGTKVFSILPEKTTDNEIEITALTVQHTSDKGIYEADDADEPYSPGGSSDEELSILPVTKVDISSGCVSNAAIPVSTDELQRKVEELTRQIEKEKKEIENLGSVTLPATTAELAPALANISIPSNLQQILASIQKPDQASDLISIEKSNDVLTSHENSACNISQEEYNPEIEFYNTKTEAESKGFKTQLTQNSLSDGSSRLANLSEAELLQMVPDDIDLTDSNSNSRDSADRQNSSPPSKKSRWDIDPPPPGLEDEYE